MNSNEMFNREKKAARLAGVLFQVGITVDEMKMASPEDWQMAADFAGCNPPNSQATIDRVLAMLEQAYADQAAEDKWEDQQMEETGADRCPPRE